MRLYMQIPASDDTPPRFYHLHLQEDLLEGWTLVKEWGNQGTASKVKRMHFTDREQAQLEFIRTRDQQIQKGYRVVFVQGAMPG